MIIKLVMIIIKLILMMIKCPQQNLLLSFLFFSFSQTLAIIKSSLSDLCCCFLLSRTLRKKDQMRSRTLVVRIVVI